MDGDFPDWGGGDNYGLSDRELFPLESFPRDDYYAPPFVPTKQVLRMRALPRYGFINNFSALLGYRSNSDVALASSQSSDDLRKDYLWGLAVGSIIILAVFVVWCLILLLLKCCGRKRVGCASGVPRKPPPRPGPPPQGQGQEVQLQEIDLDGKDVFASESNAAEAAPAAQDSSPTDADAEYEQSLARYDRQMKRFEWTIFLTRVGYLLAGVFVITASVLFYVKGIGSLIRSLNDVQDTLTYSDEVLGKSIRVADEYVESSSELREVREDFQNDVDTFCPSVSLPPGDGLGEVKAALEGVLDALAGFSNSLEKTASDLRNDLAEVQSSVNSVNEALDSAYPFLYAAIGVSIIVIIIVLCLMLSVVLAWKRRQAKNCFVRCMKNGIILPIFILFMLLAWLFATLFLFVAIGGSDFCVAPDQNTVAALELVQKSQVDPGDDPSNFIFDLLKFYVSGCDENVVPKPSNFEDEFQIMETVVGAVHDFIVFMTSDEALVAIQTLCQSSGDAFGSLNRTGTLLHGRLHIVWSALISVYEILSCQTMNPLYVGVAQQGMCVNGINGLVWIFSTQLTIAICCMIMVTLRAAAQEIEEEVEAEHNEDVSIARNILVPSTFAEESPYVEEIPNDKSSSGADNGVEKAAGTSSGGDGNEKSWLS